MKYLASTSRFAALAALAGGLLSHPAAAAPFCIQNQVMAPQCIYYDALECDHEAQKQNATCASNPKEFKLAAGAGQFCVITTSQISLCAYADRQTCSIDAARQHGTCVAAPQTAAVRAPDPYSPTNGN